MVAEPSEKKTRIESRSERAIASGCNSANTFRFPLERARPPSRIIHVKFVQQHPRRATPRAMCGQRCAFLRFAEPENDGASRPSFLRPEKGTLAPRIISSTRRQRTRLKITRPLERRRLSRRTELSPLVPTHAINCRPSRGNVTFRGTARFGLI